MAKNNENEVAIYAKIKNPEGFTSANSFEDQVQIESKFQNGVPCRVRKTVNAGKTDYVFTFKIREPGNNAVQSSQEVNKEVDETFFNSFKLVAFRLLDKRRYVFTSEKVSMQLHVGSDSHEVILPNVKYEVDCYRKPNGEFSEWCKIDVEVDAVQEFVTKQFPDIDDVMLSIKISHLPFEPVDYFLANEDDKQELKKQIWDNEFTREKYDGGERTAQAS